MKFANLCHQSLLILLCGSAMFVVGNVVLGDPKGFRQDSVSFTFPQQVPLSGWSLQDSQPLAKIDLKNGSAKGGGGWRYLFQNRTQLLTAKIIYVIDSTKPQDLRQKLHLFAKIPSIFIQPNTIRQQDNIGFYSVFIYKNIAYFSTCINPDGSTTVTESQFKLNRKLHYIQFNRLILWILGQQSLQDDRGMWVVLSLPLIEAAPESTYLILEKAGFNWIHWWRAHYPNR